MHKGRLRHLVLVVLAAMAAAALLNGSTVVGLPHAAAAGILIGDTTVEPSTDTDGIGLAESFQYTAAASGTVSNLNVYVDASSTATTLVAGIYADNSGHPGTLLTQGSVSAPIAGSWNAVTVPKVSVTSGTAYWLTLLGASGSGALAFRDQCCGG